jgi:uncharacterized protein (DUF4415 family)
MTAKRNGTGKQNKATSSRGRVDWARIDATTDADIARQIAEDPDTSPEWTDEMFASAVWVPPMTKVPIALRIAPDVLDFFRQDGPGYQSRMNAVLESYVREARARAPRAKRQKKTE